MKIGKSDALLVPNGNSSVWRYMNLDKFTRLLEDRSLYLCNDKRLSASFAIQRFATNDRFLLIARYLPFIRSMVVGRSGRPPGIRSISSKPCCFRE